MFSNVIISNVISLVLRDSDTDSENVSVIRRSVSDGQISCSLKCVSLIGKYYNQIPLYYGHISKK